MKRWLIAAALACGLNAEAQPLKGGLLGRSPSAPGTVYAPATDTTTATGTIVARNVTATALATPGAITVTPVLTQTGTINVVSGALLADGDYFTIEYEAGLTIPVEFDATPGNGTTGGRIPFIFAPGDSAGTIRDGLITLLGAAAPTKVTAAIGGAAAITLTRTPPGSTGVSITENVANAGFTVVTWGVTAATTYTYKLVWRLPDGSTTEAGAASSTAAGHATLSTSNRNDLSWAAGPAGTVTDVYRTVGGATQGKIATGITATSLSDTGLAGGGETAPSVDSTGLLKGDGLRIGTSATPGNVLTADADGYFTAQAGGGSPGGSTTQVQFNNAGAFAGDAGLTYDAGTDTLTTGLYHGIGYRASDFLGVEAAPLGVGNYLAVATTGGYSVSDTTSYSFSASSNATGVKDSGLRRVSAGLVGVTNGGAGQGNLSAATVYYDNGDASSNQYGHVMKSDGSVYWRSGFEGAYDAGLGRASAGVLKVTSGGSNLGSLQAGNYTATALGTPAVTVTNEGTAGGTTVYYTVVAFLNDGTHSGYTGTASLTSNAVLDGTNFNRISWPAVTGAAYYKAVRYAWTGTPANIGVVWTGTALTFDDTGLAGDADISALTTNTTGRILVGDGSAAVPSVAPSSLPSAGFLTKPGYGFIYAQSSAERFGFSPSGAHLSSASSLSWMDGLAIYGQTADLSIGRERAGVIKITVPPTYADNTAALAGGLTAGALYRTSTGVLMVTY